MRITLFPSARATGGQVQTKGLSQFGAEPHAIREAKDGPAVIFGDRPDRSKEAAPMVSCCAAVLDFDKVPEDVVCAAVDKLLAKEWRFWLYSTFSDNPPVSRSTRIVLPYSREVSRDEHKRIFAWLLAKFPESDKSAGAWGRLFYLPSCPPGAEPLSHLGPGDPLDVDAALASSPASVIAAPTPKAYGNGLLFLSADARKLARKLRKSPVATQQILGQQLAFAADGEPLFAKGARHQGLLDLTFAIALDNPNYSPQSVGKLFALSLVATAERDSESADGWADKVAAMYAGAAAKIQAEQREKAFIFGGMRAAKKALPEKKGEDIGTDKSSPLLPPPKLDINQKYLLRWLEEHGAHYDHSFCMVVTGAGEQIGQDVFATKLRLAAGADDMLGPKKCSRHGLTDAADNWVYDQIHALPGEIRQKLAHDPAKKAQGEQELRRFVKAVTGREDAADIAALHHFLWQAQRKLNNLPVKDHLMPVFVGKTGCGKTTAIELLTSQLELVREMPSLGVLADERHMFRLAQNFVLFFDEMKHADRADIQSIKDAITRQKLEWRVLGRNAVHKQLNNATFIGASENDLSDLITDSGGMRRFYELRCLDKIAWEEINSLDYLAIWRAVDCLQPGMLATEPGILDEIKARQGTYVAETIPGRWVTECCEIGPAVDKAEVKPQLAYESFCLWVKERRMDKVLFHWSFNKFCKWMVKNVAHNGSDAHRRYFLRVLAFSAAGGLREGTFLRAVPGGAGNTN